MTYQKDLTPEQVAAYLSDSGKCPFCTSRNVEGGRQDREGDDMTQTIACGGCGREWQDVYTLAGVEALEQTCCLCHELFEDGDEVEEGHYGLCHKNCRTFQTPTRRTPLAGADRVLLQQGSARRNVPAQALAALRSRVGREAPTWDRPFNLKTWKVGIEEIRLPNP